MTKKFILGFFILSLPKIVFAWCFDTLSIQNCIKDPNLSIFIGKVIGEEKALNVFDYQGNSLRVINIEVEKLFKGSKIYDKTISIYVENHDDIFRFNKDSVYLIYARRGDRNDIQIFRTSICERTRLISKANYDLSELAKNFQPQVIEKRAKSQVSVKIKDEKFNWFYIILVISLFLNLFLLFRRK